MTVSMREMLEVASTRAPDALWEPEDGPYIYGHRNKIHIINPRQKTQPLFNDAMKFVRQRPAAAARS